MKVLCVIGTRPEAIKMAPIVKKLMPDNRMQPIVCVTGQHREMLDGVLTLFDIKPDIDLRIMTPNQTLTGLTCALLEGLAGVIEQTQPDVLLVQGDTTTTMTASLAGFYQRIPVGHVEAGLRTGDNQAPWPEEVNRKIASVMATLHFAPTESARQNLLAENIPADRIFVTGNTVIDALQMIASGISGDTAFAAKMNALYPFLGEESGCKDDRRIILVTGHRRESFGTGFENICTALGTLARRDDVRIVYPVHLNPNVRGPVFEQLGNRPNVHLIEPLDYRSFVYFMTRSYLILTDSGGVQEEAPSLGKPVLVMRNVTERSEALADHGVKLVGADCQIIVSETQRLLDDPAEYKRMSHKSFHYGDGQASARILDILAAKLK